MPLEPPSLVEVEAAARRLQGVLVAVPSVPLVGRDDVRLKLETLQRVGSFKIRGVWHAVARLAPDARARGISTVSAGNTAQALAWCGRSFGVEARSLMPEGAPRAKVEAVRALGGTPVLVPRETLFRYLKEGGWRAEPYAFIHPWIEREVWVGHGTLGLELLAEHPPPDTVYVPVGGGGLAIGVGAALRAAAPPGHRVRIVAVEPEGCPSLHAALAAGRPVPVECQTLCDGVAVPRMTEEAFEKLAELVDESVLVPESEVRAAIRTLALRQHVVAEGAGALAVAAALRTDPATHGRAVALVTGGSLDPDTLIELLRETPA